MKFWLFTRKKRKKILFFVLLAWQNYSILRVNLMGGKSENLMEIISNLNVLIAAYLKPKSNSDKGMWDPTMKTLEGISLELFQKA